MPVPLSVCDRCALTVSPDADAGSCIDRWRAFFLGVMSDSGERALRESYSAPH